jgi:hypothetical protein
VNSPLEGTPVYTWDICLVLNLLEKILGSLENFGPKNHKGGFKGVKTIRKTSALENCTPKNH